MKLQQNTGMQKAARTVKTRIPHCRYGLEYLHFYLSKKKRKKMTDGEGYRTLTVVARKFCPKYTACRCTKERQIALNLVPLSIHINEYYESELGAS